MEKYCDECQHFSSAALYRPRTCAFGGVCEFFHKITTTLTPADKCEAFRPTDAWKRAKECEDSSPDAYALPGNIYKITLE